MYDIRIDDRTNLVSIRLGGLLSLDEATRYVHDLSAAFIRHKMRAGYLMMIDTTQATIQSQEVVTAFQTHITRFPKARRIAMINGDSLARMQTKRVMTQDYTRIFATVAEGEEYLFGPEASVVRSASRRSVA